LAPGLRVVAVLADVAAGVDVVVVVVTVGPMTRRILFQDLANLAENLRAEILLGSIL
jgi:3-hydroxyisobutyrate dehydrogenase-like beta-hydroxyacid dehydrogenase